MGKLSDELLRAIDFMIQKRIEKMSSSDLTAIVTKTSDKYCFVQVNGQEYKVKNGTTHTFSAGEICLIRCINGDFNNKIIIAKM